MNVLNRDRDAGSAAVLDISWKIQDIFYFLEHTFYQKSKRQASFVFAHDKYIVEKNFMVNVVHLSDS